MKIRTFDEALKKLQGKFKFKKENQPDQIVASYFVHKKQAFSDITYYYVRKVDGTETLYLCPGYKLVAGENFLSKKQLESLQKKDYKTSKEFVEKEPTQSHFNRLVSKYKESRTHQFYNSVYAQGFNYLTSLYYEEDEKYLEAYQALYKAVKKECDHLGIKYETDPKIILSQKLETVYEEDEFKTQDIRVCSSEESIDEYYKTNILPQTNRERLSHEITSLAYLKADFTMGYNGNYLMNSDELLSALADRTLPNRETILKNYMEFFISADLSFGIIKHLGQLIDEANIIQYNMEQERYNSNIKFLDDLEHINKHNPNEETYRYHATANLEDAKRIMEEGFYLYSDDLDSTSFPEFGVNDILSYSYGNGFEFFGDYIVIISVPNAEDVVQHLSPEEQENVTIVPRRNALIGNKPEYKVDTKHIVGIVDKKNEKVIQNPEYANKSKKQINM